MNNPLRTQSLPVLTLLAALVGLGVVLQLWLLGTSLDHLLSQRDEAGVPATLASLALFLVNLGLLGYVMHLDRRVREYNSTPGADKNTEQERLANDSRRPSAS